MWRRLLILSMLAAGTGCAADATSVTRWVREQGGMVADSDQVARARQSAADLLAGHADVHVRVDVIARDDLAAFSWPDGHVYLSRGLVERLDDAELAAAVAHELGHLMDRPGIRAVAGLHGGSGPRDREARADAIGAALLEERHVPRESMARMLRRVMDQPSLPERTRQAMRHRVELLDGDPSTATASGTRPGG